MTDKEDIFVAFRSTEGQDAPESKSANRVKAKQEPTGDEEYVLPPLRPEVYAAFSKGKRGERLLIDRAAAPMRFPAYHELRDISFDQAFQQGFNMFFQAMTVEVMGKNLWPVVHAIASGRCAGLYEYHAKLYPALPAKGEPLIESIRLLPPEPLADDTEE